MSQHLAGEKKHFALWRTAKQAVPHKAVYCTVIDAVAECVIVPLVPVIINDLVPARVFGVVLMVSVLVPAPLIEAGEKLAVAFLGRFATVRLTAPAKPFSAPMVMVYVVLAGRTTVREAGDTAMVKSGVGAAAWLIQIGADHISSPELNVM